MSAFVQLNDVSGRKVFIDPHAVTCIRTHVDRQGRHKACTVIHTGEAFVLCPQPIDLVVDKIDRARGEICIQEEPHPYDAACARYGSGAVGTFERWQQMTAHGFVFGAEGWKHSSGASLRPPEPA